MKKENVLLVVIVLVVGVLVGILAVKMGQKPSKPASAPASAAPAVNLQQTIKMLEGIVANDPTNRNAWAELGHNYFDSDQPVKAIEAYDKALALGPDDPNILTDQGVMFRSCVWGGTTAPLRISTRLRRSTPGIRRVFITWASSTDTICRIFARPRRPGAST